MTNVVIKVKFRLMIHSRDAKLIISADKTRKNFYHQYKLTINLKNQFIMKNSIVKLKNAKKLSRNEQISILGGSSCFTITCGITKAQCDDLQGRINKQTGCCGYVPLNQNC